MTSAGSSLGLAAAIRRIERLIDACPNGLPEEVFLFLSRTTPLVNVDLLIQDDRRRTLLTWRNDEHFGPGWHVPGGIIRFREAAADRIRAVAALELGANVTFEPAPIMVHESIDSGRRNRGHAVSLLYRCRLASDPDSHRQCGPGAPLAGQWRWHDRCPENLIPEQRAYSAFMA